MNIESKEIKILPIDEIAPNPGNRNKHSDEQIAHLVEQYKYQGFRNPLVISNRSGLLVAGHGRLLAAKKAGLKELPVIYQDFESDEQEYAYGVAENATQAWAELDLSGINSDLANLGPDFNIDLLGIKDFVLEPAELIPKCDEDEIPDRVEPRTKLGDIYQLGIHRLMCGDSTSIDSVEKLMDGKKADMCFTSPPYNLGNNAKLRGHNGDGKDSAYVEKSDHKTESEYLDFLSAFTSIALAVSDTVFVNIQILAGNKFVVPYYWKLFSQNLIDLFVWDKEHAPPQMAARVLNSVWEFIFIFGKDDRPTRSMKHGPNFRGTIDNIYRLNPVGKKDPLAKDHGAVFPVKFAEFFLSSFSDATVYEPFGGSGTVLIAAEKLGRKSFSMELSPQYCDVIIARWEQYTGGKAQLLGSDPS